MIKIGGKEEIVQRPFIGLVEWREMKGRGTGSRVEAPWLVTGLPKAIINLIN